jgi:hypothetical protein
LGVIVVEVDPMSPAAGLKSCLPDPLGSSTPGYHMPPAAGCILLAERFEAPMYVLSLRS